MNNYNKYYDINCLYDLCIEYIEKIKKLTNNKIELKLEKADKNYYFIEKYINKKLKTKKYDSIDTLFYYIKSIYELIQDFKELEENGGF